MKFPLLDLKAQYKSIEKELKERVSEVLDSQMFILGAEVKALEEELIDRDKGIEDAEKAIESRENTFKSEDKALKKELKALEKSKKKFDEERDPVTAVFQVHREFTLALAHPTVKLHAHFGGRQSVEQCQIGILPAGSVVLPRFYLGIVIQHVRESGQPVEVGGNGAALRVDEPKVEEVSRADVLESRQGSDLPGALALGGGLEVLVEE